MIPVEGLYLKINYCLLAVGLNLFFLPLWSQTPIKKTLGLDECIQTAFKNNENVALAAMETEFNREQKKLAFELPKTTFLYTQGQFNSVYRYDNIFGVSQTFPSPGLLAAQSSLSKARLSGSQLREVSVKAELRRQVSETYYTIQHHMQELYLLQKLDSLYEIFLHMQDSSKPLAPSEDDLEQAAKVSEAYQIQITYNDYERELNQSKLHLQWLMRAPEMPEIEALEQDKSILYLDTSAGSMLNHPELQYLMKQIDVAQKAKQVEKQKLEPDLVLGYFNQSIYGPGSIDGNDYFLTTKDRLQGFQIGFAFPLYFTPYQAKIQSGKIHERIIKEEYEQKLNEMSSGLKMALNNYRLSNKNLLYYQNYILKNSRSIAAKSLEAYNKKEINYVEYLALISRTYDVFRSYLGYILQNNLAVIQVNYYLSLDQK